MPLSSTSIVTSPPLGATRTHTFPSGSRRNGAVLHGVVEQVGDRRRQLAAIAEHHERELGDVGDDLHPDVGGDDGNAPRSLADRVGDVDGHQLRRLALDEGEIEDVVDQGRHTARLELHPVEQPGSDRLVVGVVERFGQHGERTDRRLQLVADIGDEVAPDGLDPLLIRDIGDLDGDARAQLIRQEHLRAPGTTRPSCPRISRRTVALSPDDATSLASRRRPTAASPRTVASIEEPPGGGRGEADLQVGSGDEHAVGRILRRRRE